MIGPSDLHYLEKSDQDIQIDLTQFNTTLDNYHQRKAKHMMKIIKWQLSVMQRSIEGFSFHGMNMCVCTVYVCM